MIYLVFERATGRVVSHIVADAEPVVMDHHDTIEADAVPDYQSVRVVAGEIVAHVEADYLASEKRRLIDRIDVARDARLAAGATTPAGCVQADLASRTNIAGAVNMAILSPDDFSVEWRLADNSTIILDATAMLAVGQLVGAFVSTTYAQSFSMKDTVQSLSDLQDIKDFAVTFE